MSFGFPPRPSRAGRRVAAVFVAASFAACVASAPAATPPPIEDFFKPDAYEDEVRKKVRATCMVIVLAPSLRPRRLASAARTTPV